MLYAIIDYPSNGQIDHSILIYICYNNNGTSKCYIKKTTVWSINSISFHMTCCNREQSIKWLNLCQNDNIGFYLTLFKTLRYIKRKTR